MIWLLRDLDFLAVLLRAASLAAEAITVGGIAFLVLIAIPVDSGRSLLAACRRWIGWSALSLAVTQVIVTVTNLTLLNANSNQGVLSLLSSGFVLAGSGAAIAAMAISICSRGNERWAAYLLPALAFVLVGAAVCLSHPASRLENRPILVCMIVVHHLATATWIGAMPFLLIALKCARDDRLAATLVRRFSWMAIFSVSALVLSGLSLASSLVGSWQALYGTSYGLSLTVKLYFLLLILILAASNRTTVRLGARACLLLRVGLRRFTEAEIGLGFAVILVAASLGSQTPAIDTPQDRVTAQEIAARFRPRLPSLHSPSIAALSPPVSMAAAVQAHAFTGESVSDATDRQWSEYNHHWAGIVVLLAGFLALLSRYSYFTWTHHWPLAFVLLAGFVLLRADPENWPLGPRPFWSSFSQPDVLAHRVSALLILGFAGFEWGVQTERLRSRWGRLVFPSLCALGGALLLLHTHTLGATTDDVLAQIPHTLIAALGITAAASRWLELRLPRLPSSTLTSWLWPICLILAGCVLLNYRET